MQEFVNIYQLTTGQRCFAVEDDGQLTGLITLRDVSRIPRDRWELATVGEAMRPGKELHTVSPDTPVLDALKLMVRNDINQLPVVAQGTFQGIVSRAQIMQLLQIRGELRLPTAYRPPPELSARNDLDVRSLSQMSSRHSRAS